MMDAKTTLIVTIALTAGFMLGMMYQQRTDEHKWFMLEYKKNADFQKIMDVRLDDLLKDGMNENEKENDNGKSDIRKSGKERLPRGRN